MIRLENVTKKFGDKVVIDNITFRMNRGEFLFILGPSGCGKTTLLRLLAGFYKPDAGNIFLNEVVINETPPYKRNTGMVFQNYALWPHMTVEENIGYGLDIRKVPKEEKARLVEQALDMVHMKEYAKYQPGKISGGQQQRVALARAMVVKPDILLLDEPLSNLDAKLRLEMRDEIRRIQKETHATMIYVTHDRVEALSLADRIVIINRGRIEQIGTPQEIYRKPATKFVSEFIGEVNFLDGKILDYDKSKKIVHVSTRDGEIICATDGSFIKGEDVFCIIRPELFRIGEDSGMENVNKLKCKLIDKFYHGDYQEYKFATASGINLKVNLFGANIKEIEKGAFAELLFLYEDVFVVKG